MKRRRPPLPRSAGPHVVEARYLTKRIATWEDH
jgi:hypothetical protein